MEVNEQSEPLTPEMVTAVKALWGDTGVREAFERRAEFQLVDSAKQYVLTVRFNSTF